jgi:LmbE family N-acetylglucosaminyl deacetylase
LAKLAAAGVRTALVCLTRGEAGQSSGLAQTKAELAAVRTAELRCSAATLGISELVLLDYPDAGAATWDRAAVAADLRDAIERIRPDVIVTFDEFGVTKHPDHIATHHVVTALLENAPDRLGVRRLFYNVLVCPEGGLLPAMILVCAPPEAIAVTVDIDAFAAAKRAALECHRSQATDVVEWFLVQGHLHPETFVLAWDTQGWQPAPGECDLFAGWA